MSSSIVVRCDDAHVHTYEYRSPVHAMEDLADAISGSESARVTLINVTCFSTDPMRQLVLDWDTYRLLTPLILRPLSPSECRMQFALGEGYQRGNDVFIKIEDACEWVDYLYACGRLVLPLREMTSTLVIAYDAI